MNRFQNSAQKLIISFHFFPIFSGAIDPPITLFMYSEFVEAHPALVERWSQYFEIASRGERYFLPGVFDSLVILVLILVCTTFLSVAVSVDSIFPWTSPEARECFRKQGTKLASRCAETPRQETK